MREIKFRVWRVGQKHLNETGMVMDYNPGIDVDWGRLPINHFFANELVDGGPPGEKTDYVFMQYTGLKDNNGTEIYEGDILSCGRGFVEFDDGCYWLSEGSLKLSEMNSHWEVIGNIYENPELLSK